MYGLESAHYSFHGNIQKENFEISFYFEGGIAREGEMRGIWVHELKSTRVTRKLK